MAEGGKAAPALSKNAMIGAAVIVIIIVVAAVVVLALPGGKNANTTTLSTTTISSSPNTPPTISASTSATTTVSAPSNFDQCHIAKSGTGYAFTTGVNCNQNPEYAARLVSGSYIAVPTAKQFTTNMSNYTVYLWYNQSSLNTTAELISTRASGSDTFDIQLGKLQFGGTGIHLEIGNGNSWLVNYNYTFSQTAKSWHNIAVTVGNNAWTLYLDGSIVNTAPLGGAPVFTTPGSYIYIGSPKGCPGCSYPSQFYGEVSNLQIYNTSIQRTLITSMYNAGTGSAPVDPAHTVGWWMFNQTTTDLSTLGTNATGYGISYVPFYP